MILFSIAGGIWWETVVLQSKGKLSEQEKENCDIIKKIFTLHQNTAALFIFLTYYPANIYFS